MFTPENGDEAVAQSPLIFAKPDTTFYRAIRVALSLTARLNVIRSLAVKTTVDNFAKDELQEKLKIGKLFFSFRKLQDKRKCDLGKGKVYSR